MAAASLIHWASVVCSGTKDKRGVTSQFVTAYKISPQRLAALNPRLRGVKLGNFEYVDTELRLGMLSGNMFKVGARDSRVVKHGQRSCRTQLWVASSFFVLHVGMSACGAGM